MKELILYQINEGPTRITVKVLDFDGKIKIDGYDVGQSVKGIFGYSDYEYSMEVNKSELEVLINESCDYLDIFTPYIGNSKCFTNIKKKYLMKKK